MSTHIRSLIVCFLLLAGLTVGCSKTPKPVPVPSVTQNMTPSSTHAQRSTPTLVPSFTMTDIPSATVEPPTQAPVPSYAQTFPSGLRVEEYALIAAPQVEPRKFDPLQSSQAAILEKHRLERLDYYAPDIVYGQERLVYAATGKSSFLAKELYSYVDGVIKVTVEVSKEGQVIYSAPAGNVNPMDHVLGLWVYGEHWTVEYANSTNDMPSPDEIEIRQAGQIVQDGILLNQRDSLQEGFGFQLISDSPFYFFKKAGKIGASYAGQALPLTYDDIPHYGCCSSAALNPVQARNMVAFFAKRGGIWYYVEIGKYEDK